MLGTEKKSLGVKLWAKVIYERDVARLFEVRTEILVPKRKNQYRQKRTSKRVVSPTSDECLLRIDYLVG